jgi:hypothetical protein
MNSLYGSFRQLYFSQVFPDVTTWNEKLSETQITLPIKQDNLDLLYYLLYSKYGNSVVASSDINRFVFSVARVIFQFAPTWETRLRIQEALRDLSQEDLMKGATDIYNHSYNPSEAPSTQATEELPTINEQTVTKRKKAPLDAYAYLWDLLDTDVTGYFLDQFKNLFLTIVQPERPLYYVTED